MGAWSHTSFGNDDAFDFVAEVKEDGEAAIANAFEVINFLDPAEFIDSADSYVAVAAAEFVAASMGKPPAEFPDKAADIIPRLGQLKALKPDAIRALQRLLDSADLKEVWVLEEDYVKWRAGVKDLIERLK
jgi:hypothetical protein